jgi:hypothetical protein
MMGTISVKNVRGQQYLCKVSGRKKTRKKPREEPGFSSCAEWRSQWLWRVQQHLKSKNEQFRVP